MSQDTPAVIRRPDKGLTISGTRVTLYSLMDYLHAGWAEDDIRAWLNLTPEQVRVALDYIAAHRDEVEAEYQEVLRQAEAQRQHWEARLSEHLTRTPRATITPEKAALYAKLAEQRRKTLAELLRADTASSSEPVTQ